MRPPCRSHALGASSSACTSPFVDTLDDAVFVVDASVGGGSPSFGAVALLLDDDDRLLTAIECQGCATGERVVELCRVLLAAASPTRPWRRLVVASSPDVGAGVADWSALVDVVAPSPVELVDWLVVDLPSGAARSLCDETTGDSPW